MYATAMQLNSYKTVQKTTMSGREIEAAALTNAAQILKECQKNWDANDRDSKLADACRVNQRVWTIFQAELAKEDNPLPKQIKQDILTLSLFIDRRIIEVLAFPALEKLDAIININLNIAAGLRGSPA